MAEILLAHPFFLKNDPKQVKKMRPYPPLGTLYAASNLRSRGHSVALFDAMLADGLHEYEEALGRERPNVVVLYEDQFNFLMKMCLKHMRDAACRMADLARRGGATVIAAGADVSDECEAYFERGVDYALTGEADHGLAQLVGALTGRRPHPIDAIPGLSMPGVGGVLRTPKAAPERDLDRFPFPAWDLLDIERYRSAWQEAHGYFSLNLVTTRGCPFHCNWCAKPIWGQRYAIRSPANVAEEMAMIKFRYRPDHLWFADDIFGLQPRWVTEFADEVAARDASIPFMIQTRADLMTDRAAEGLARAGCVEVWLGAESGSQKILDAMDKGITIHQIHAARDRIRRAGIRACFFIQLGYPGDDYGDILATRQLLRETMPDDIGVSVSYPLPGTKFYAMVRTQLDDKDHWEDSGDLAMMFHGTYQTPFYRRVHKILHRELELRHRLRDRPNDDDALELDDVLAEWDELGRTEAESLNATPTSISKEYGPVMQPDLSRRWN